ncbi:MAG: hypothetical protein AB7U75_19650 [Hyphomicrobiaceae bacterium]
MGSSNEQKVRIQYLNTDLLLESESDLHGLARHFEAADCYALYLSEDGHHAGFESGHAPLDSTPAQTISMLMDVIERLEGQHLAAWNACTSRELDVGYACGCEPYSANDLITSQLLRRMADAEISLVITLYGLRRD